eukprot:CAMPEP_0184489284 /NCGR_PEP_ID=MMETSP0113_2-20130426/14974_1 /TAXON_ID=91329 /ORGANISM="Norrisiella sphaerica, Strain BC52" /LENGTH=1466 /DNA_ID=CAMNT_0026872607 /DNA_START=326 /DNA_END=4726 /DNA_ORIENTATION=-
MSRLHLAAASGSMSELDELISMKFDVNAVSGEGSNGRQTPLMLAARNGHLEPVIKLLKSGAELEVADSYGQTALLRAVRGAQVAVVRVILEHKANVDNQDHYGVTALHMAVEMDSAETISLLVSFGANMEITSNNKCQFPFMTPLRLAVALNSIESAQELLELKANVDSKDAHGTTPLLDALSRQKHDMLCLILRYNPNLYVSSRQTEGVMPLSFAAGKLKVPFLVLLVEAKADVNKIDLGGKTALHFAARTNNIAAVEYLLRVGADYTLRDKTNRDPASYGAQYGSKGAVKLLEAAWMNSGGSPRTADPLSQVKQKYTINKKLGEGAFGKVLAVQHKKNGNDYACKFIKRKKLSESAEAYLDSEIEIMFEVPHPGICRLYEVIRTKQAVCLIMEVLRGGDVLQKIVEKDVLDEKEAARVVRSVSSTLGFLHSLGILHRDLKPDNLMYRTSEPDSDVVIVDFGVAKHLASSEKFASSACGTPLYLAPEVIVGPQYTHMCDMWSLGVILYVMLCGRPPFYAKDRSHLFRKIKEGNFSFPDKYWKNVSQGAKDLISELLIVDPKKRATPKRVAAHPWIRKHAVKNFEEEAPSENAADELKKRQQMAQGFASLGRVVRFLVAFKQLYHVFDLGSIDGASLRLLGAYRQGMFKIRATTNASVPNSCTLKSRRLSHFKENLLQPLMVVHVKNFEGEYVIERKYEGELPGMEGHWWVSGPEGEMHVVSPMDITPVDKKGQEFPIPFRKPSFHKGKPVQVDIKLEHTMRLLGPSESKGKKVVWTMIGSREEIMDILEKKDRMAVMFWNHMRLFIKQFGKVEDQKEIDEHKMVSEAKRIQLMFLKSRESVKLAHIPKTILQKLDQTISKNKVDAHIFDNATHVCKEMLQMRLWDRIKVLNQRAKQMFAKAKSEGAENLKNRLSLVLPKRLLDLMGSLGQIPEAKDERSPIYESDIEIASMQTDEEQSNDLRAKLQKILSSEQYTELNALAKVVGEDCDLLVPGRRLHYAALVKKKSRMVFTSMSERKLVLCNDILAWLTPKLKLQRFLALKDIELIEMKSDEPRFGVIHGKKTYEFICNTPIEAKQWLNVIRKTKEEWKLQNKNRRKTTHPKGEGVLSDIKHNQERAFSRMKRHALRDLIKRMKTTIDVKNRSKGFQTHANAFVGEEFVKWMIREKLVPSVNEAVRIGNELVVSGYVEHVNGDHGFRNNNFLYKINDKLVKVGDRGAAVVRTLGNTKTQHSISRSISNKLGAQRQKISWLHCRAKIIWKIEGRTRVPHAVLCLWSDAAPGEDDIIVLADARATADAKDDLKLRVVPGGISLSEDDSYYEEYQIKCPSKEDRDKWVKMLNSLQSRQEVLETTLKQLLDRAEKAFITFENIQLSRETEAQAVTSNGSLNDPDAYYVNVGGSPKPIYLRDFLHPNDFPYPKTSHADLEDILLQGLNAYFAELMGEEWTGALASLWKLLTANSRHKLI